MLFELLPVPIISKNHGYIAKAYFEPFDEHYPSEIYVNSVPPLHTLHWRSHKRAHLTLQVISGSVSSQFHPILAPPFP